MAAQQNFRTAFNGFNREDVVHYIDYLNAKYTAEIQQLNSELEFLRGKQSQESFAPAAQPETDDVDPMVEQQAARIRELFDQNKALDAELAGAKAEKDQLAAQLAEAIQAGTEIENEKNQLIQQLEETREAQSQAAQQLETALQQQTSYQSRMEEELEAYRRAERTERLARERAEQLYRQANGALADATVKVDDTANQIGELSDRVMSQLAELQTAITGSKQALRDAAATMYTIRPSTEEA